MGEDLPCYANKILTIWFKKCLRDHQPTDSVYLSDIRYQVLSRRWRRKPAGINTERNDVTVTPLVQYVYKLGDIYGWRRGVVVSGVRRMNEVNARWARLVPGWVTVFGRVYHLGM